MISLRQVDSGQNTDRTDRSCHHPGEGPAKQHISTRSISGRYSRERSIMIPGGQYMMISTDREKVLQIPALRAVRAMRSVFCWMLLTPEDLTSNRSRSTDLDHGPSKPP